MGVDLSTGLHFERMLLGWPSFEDWLLGKRDALFANIARMPLTLCLRDVVCAKGEMVGASRA